MSAEYLDIGWNGGYKVGYKSGLAIARSVVMLPP